MNIIKKILFNHVNILYALITVMLLSSVAIISPITTELNIVILIWGGIYFIYDFLNNKTCLKSRYKSFLIAYMLVFFIGVLINIKNNPIDNIKNFIYSGFFLFLVYSYNSNKLLDKVKRELINFNNIVISISSIVGFASLMTFIFFIQFTYNDIPQGFIYPDSPALWGFYSNPNSGGMVSVLSIILTIVNISLYKVSSNKNKAKLRNTYYIINIIIQWLYLVLCNSRGAVVSLLASILFLTFYLCYYRYNIKFSNIKSIFIALFISILVLMAYNFTLSISKISLSYIPELIESTYSKDKNIDTSKDSSIILDRTIEDGHISTGRVEIWTYGLNTLKFNPLFGHAPSNIGLAKQNLYPNETSRYIITNNMHNGYIQILLANGILGILFFGTFIILIAKDSLLYLFDKRLKIDVNQKKLIFLILLPIISIAVNGLFENVILLTQSYITTILWTYLGYLSLNIDKSKSLK
ncbi:O-antigen ligase family protein [Clostridium sp. C8]|jgi:O-antigen ligase|uniref:O-antigen ligase family protein n=1 Tax=Clostridium sp. C8 TaxID=1667357 RepID=UPI00062E5373|nr:O-antigen ligase family protein [Clostridium sp. C8]KLE14625.1 hypothetical protein AAT22_15610 [Clostridium sp. C8]